MSWSCTPLASPYDDMVTVAMSWSCTPLTSPYDDMVTVANDAILM